MKTNVCKMSRNQAWTMDEDFVSDYDDVTNSYGVFGVSSTFCYSLHDDERDAETEAEALRTGKARDE